MATNPIFIGSPLTTSANTQIANTITNSDGTSTKDVVNGATNGTVVQDLIAVSDDTSDVNLKIFFYDGSSSRQIGMVKVAAGSGADVTKASTSLLNTDNIPSLAKRDDGVILLASGQKLQVAAASAVTSGKTVTVTAIGGNL